MRAFRSASRLIVLVLPLVAYPSKASPQRNWYGQWGAFLTVPSNAVALRSFNLPWYDS